jgi:PhnB protein
MIHLNTVLMTNSEIKNFNKDADIPTSIAPWLSVLNGIQAVDFYKSAFGAVEAYRLETPDGGLVAKLSVDGAEFWLSGESQGDGSLQPEAPAGGSVRMILTVSDPDAFFIRALEAGASQVFPVGEEHGWRLGRLVDPFGHHWEIGRPVTT